MPALIMHKIGQPLTAIAMREAAPPPVLYSTATYFATTKLVGRAAVSTGGMNWARAFFQNGPSTSH
jgi:hypothetical protein